VFGAKRSFIVSSWRACPGHPRFQLSISKTWMPGTRPGMTGLLFTTASIHQMA
jgi:hypothetical protein